MLYGIWIGSSPCSKEATVHLHVLPASQRIALYAVASQESLIYHKSQWVGIFIQREHENVESGSLLLEPVTRGLRPGPVAFVCQVQAGGCQSQGEWVKPSENGAISLTTSCQGPASILVWVVMGFDEQELNEKPNQQSAGKTHSMGDLLIFA